MVKTYHGDPVQCSLETFTDLPLQSLQVYILHGCEKKTSSTKMFLVVKNNFLKYMQFEMNTLFD